MNSKAKDALVLAGIVAAVAAIALIWWWPTHRDTTESGPESFQSDGVHVITHDQQSGTTSGEDAEPQSSADPALVDAADVDGLTPEGAKSVSGDPTLSIPVSSALSDEDAIAASQTARRFVEAAWEVSPGDYSPWTAFVGAIDTYGTDELRTEYDATDIDPARETLLGPWTGASKGTMRYHASINLTQPADPTGQADPATYEVTVWYTLMRGDAGTSGLTPMGERAPAALTMTKTDGQWKVSRLPDAEPPWIGYYLENTPG